jgi:hypothetical protein
LHAYIYRESHIRDGTFCYTGISIDMLSGRHSLDCLERNVTYIYLDGHFRDRNLINLETLLSTLGSNMLRTGHSLDCLERYVFLLKSTKGQTRQKCGEENQPVSCSVYNDTKEHTKKSSEYNT